MVKIDKIASTVAQGAEAVVKKASEVPKKTMINQEEFCCEQQQKILSESVASQGKALININKKNSKQEAITNRLATTRKVVKAIPLSKNAKSEILSSINAVIENRYITKNLSGKSAKESAEAILEKRPVDLEVKKEELLAKYGEKFQQKKQQKAQELCKARQECALKSAIRNLRQQFLQDTRDFVSVLNFIERKIPKAQMSEFINLDNYAGFWKILCEIKNKSKNMTEFTYQIADYVGKMFSDKGLLFAKEVIAKIPSDEVSPRIKSEFLSIINGELESRITTKNLANRSTEEIKEVFLNANEKELGIYQADLEDKLTKRKEELMKEFGEQFENRPARKSAKAIKELNPKDLSAKKIELRKKFGNQTIIKSIMLDKNLGYDEARACAMEEIASDSKFFGISLEEAESRLEQRAQVVIELYEQSGKV